MGKASMGHDRVHPHQKPQHSFSRGAPSGAGHAQPVLCLPQYCAIKSLYPQTSHTISTEQSQPHLKLLKAHFHQTAVKWNERGVWPRAVTE